jgi:hypothetical protein
MNIPNEIVEVRTSLEQAEKETDPIKKYEELRDGLDSIEFYLEEQQDPPEDLTLYIVNLKRSHTRRLLTQLISLMNLEIDVWLKYVVILITELQDEVKFAIKSDQTLKDNYDKFLSVWSDVLQEAAKKLESSK